MVLRKQVRCELTGKKTYDRCVGACYLDGMKIEEDLVRIGLARHCPSIFWRSVPRGRTGGSGQGATIRKAYRLPGYCRAR
jgi:endonuclease YncB( thermonuclease family)